MLVVKLAVGRGDGGVEEGGRVGGGSSSGQRGSARRRIANDGGNGVRRSSLAGSSPIIISSAPHCGNLCCAARRGAAVGLEHAVHVQHRSRWGRAEGFEAVVAVPHSVLLCIGRNNVVLCGKDGVEETLVAGG